MTCALWKNWTDDMYERRMWISPTKRGKAQRGGERMSSAQIHVRKSQKKTTTREHISKKHTQQRENTSKTHENTPKGKHNWKWFVFHFHCFFCIWGFLPQKEAKRKEARAHVICSMDVIKTLKRATRPARFAHASKTLEGKSSRWHALYEHHVRRCMEQMTCA